MSVRPTGLPKKDLPLALRLGEYLVPRPSSTFFFRLESDSILVVDRSLPHSAGSLAAVATEGGF